MINDALVKQLLAAVEHRQHAGSPVQFWLRDDDAIAPSEPLERLLALTTTYSVPVTLAVIPALSGKALAQHLDNRLQVSVAVHGWSHSNHAPPGEKKQELGAHRPVDDILGELQCGYSHLAGLHKLQFVPLLVPPWNRISPSVVERLHEPGFQGLSTFGDSNTAAITAITVINTHVDLIDWKGTRGGRDHDTLAAELIAHIQNTINPIGILSHHLVHDAAVWHFLEQLFAITAKQPGCEWVSIGRLLSES